MSRPQVEFGGGSFSLINFPIGGRDQFIDLGQTNPDTGEYIYQVVDTLSCQDLGLNPRDYLTS